MKCVIYTVITGYKEPLNNPFQDIEISSSYERICFTDDPSLTSDVWKVVLLQSHWLHPVYESRRPKLLPHHFLPEFDVSLYIDNTVRFKVDPHQIFDYYSKSPAPLVCFPHPDRDCAYTEGEAVIRMGFEQESHVRNQLDFYAEQGMPHHAGLIAGTVLLRRHHDPQLVQLSEAWFQHVLSFSRRDQISFSFLAWVHQFSPSYFSGSLTDNPWVMWHGFGPYPRIPGDFDEKIYRWLNLGLGVTSLAARQHYLEQGIYHQLPYRTYHWELNQLANQHQSDKGTLYYNRHGYAAIYEQYLRPLRDQSFTLVEMGLLRHDQQAKIDNSIYEDIPSLRMWSSYLPHAQIYGFDIANFSKAHLPDRVSIFQGDMGNKSDLLNLVQALGSQVVQVIVDDASHASHHQQVALSELFKLLTPGGYYFIEDLHYQPNTLEVENCPKTLDILKALKYQFPINTPFIGAKNLDYLKFQIESIDFYDSLDRQFGFVIQDALAVIRKKSIPDVAQSQAKLLYFLVELDLSMDVQQWHQGLVNCINKVANLFGQQPSELVVKVPHLEDIEEVSDIVLMTLLEWTFNQDGVEPLLTVKTVYDLDEAFPHGLISWQDLSRIFVINTDISLHNLDSSFKSVNIDELASLSSCLSENLVD